MKTHRILAVAALATLTTSAMAQQAPDVERITFQQAIDLALRQNVAIQQAQNSVENSRTFVTQARNTWLPTFGVSVNGSNSIGQQFDVQTGTLVTKQSQAASGGISSGFTLFDPNR